MRDLFAPLTSVEIYQGCRTPSDGSEFSESSWEPTLSPSSSAREIYEGLRTPDWLQLSQRSVDIVGVPVEKSEGISPHGSARSVFRTFTFRELVAASNNFADDRLLGRGGFGRVYKGRLKITKQVVAIKQFINEEKLVFLVEVLMHGLLHHPHIVEFIGYCADGNQMLVVHEYMPFGSLEDHLHDLPSGKNHLDWNTRMKIAAGVAKGLEFLHDKTNPPVIFRALKSSNILLGEDYNPKLSDFGIATLGPIGARSVSRRVIGTQGYCAPEYLLSGELSLKSDIYNFGVVLLEIITGRKAFDNSEDAVAPSLVAWARPLFEDQRRLEQMADPVLQGQYPKKGFLQAVAVAAVCLQEQPAARPAIADVVTALTYNIASQPYIPHALPPVQGSHLARITGRKIMFWKGLTKPKERN
ncbi:hypothetical protein H6P81_017250 [Aristolochia fimbriata]|uniref:Protein kinase domain-containing protein n=1 Tax=Aristolochia fimbriata TaxID=158543 RepID=A0AAV7DYZ5_ARIFI|nr:hypothetical protein H6P81_017250 [Aristolochia fimbriata]